MTTTDQHDVLTEAVAKEERIARTKKFWRWFWLIAAATPFLLPVLGYGCIRVLNPGAGAANIRVSEATTHITEPLDENGLVDYLAAVNMRASEGVTPENNAAVLILQAVGPSGDMKPEMLAEFYSLLGIEPLDPAGEYLVEWDDFSEAHPDLLPPGTKSDDAPWSPAEDDVDFEQAYIDTELAINAAIAQRDRDAFHRHLREAIDLEPRTSREIFDIQMAAAMKFPWSEDDFPAVAAWLAMNERALDLAVEASRRSKFYAPRVTDADSLRLIMARYHLLYKMRAFSTALSIRAMHDLRADDAESAWEDLHAVHRLARLAGQDSSLIGALVSYAMESIATGSVAQLAASNLSPELLVRIRKDLSELAPLANIADKLDHHERWAFLEATCDVAREGGINETGILSRWNDQLVDWNSIMIDGNEYFDAMVAYARAAPSGQRDPASEELIDEIDSITGEEPPPLEMAVSFLSGTARTEFFKDQLLAMLLPGLNSAVSGQLRTDAHGQTVQLAFAVVAYQQQHGELPQQLDDLVPEFMAEIPADVYSGQPFVYRKTEIGFMIYTVGPNGKDDGGPDENSDLPLSDMDFGIVVPPKFDGRDVGLRPW